MSDENVAKEDAAEAVNKAASDADVWRKMDHRREALSLAVNRTRSSGGLMVAAPGADDIVKEAEKFAAFLDGDSASE